MKNWKPKCSVTEKWFNYGIPNNVAIYIIFSKNIQYQNKIFKIEIERENTILHYNLNLRGNFYL